MVHHPPAIVSYWPLLIVEKSVRDVDLPQIRALCSQMTDQRDYFPCVRVFSIVSILVHAPLLSVEFPALQHRLHPQAISISYTFLVADYQPVP